MCEKVCIIFIPRNVLGPITADTDYGERILLNPLNNASNNRGHKRKKLANFGKFYLFCLTCAKQPLQILTRNSSLGSCDEGVLSYNSIDSKLYK